MVKRFVIALVLVVLVVGGLVGFNRFRAQAIEQFFANMPVAPVTVSVSEAKAVTWVPVVEAIGTVRAASGVDLTVETTGIVTEVAFTSNQRVNEGDLLVRLDDAVQRANYEAGVTQAELDRQALERALELQRRGVGSNVAADTAQAAASSSAAQVAALQAVLDQKQVIAPFSGVIGIARVEVGQYVAPGTVVATLQDLDTMLVNFTVPEQDLPVLEIGQPVRMGATTADMRFEGAITGIDPKIDPASRLASIQAEITNPDGTLTPGQFVQIRVALPPEEGVIALPQTALVTSLYGDYVYAVRERQPDPAAPPAAAAAPAAGAPQGAAQPAAADAPQLVAVQVFVTPGRRSGDLVEIVSGTSPGESIVDAGQNRLSNGAVVVIDNTVAPASGNAPAVAAGSAAAAAEPAAGAAEAAGAPAAEPATESAGTTGAAATDTATAEPAGGTQDEATE
ncbi:efflux RND transporter periplasmic adaptor subunit [Paracoccus sp. S-4012]|uniref:efflux RND transporter periplasmic adaptor subunit n=1 Tax=Paracoccus sp. S-4012 TaxID=2665648 RepID=UPI0012AF95D4|nr:efflux RND transporter periplasmic adaptor subunit [Paracoccus sp. S-4012]MRX49948.1 efflux RND transporter periplasmic adaptor subunit [Paracoccus sp. S-4012]